MLRIGTIYYSKNCQAYLPVTSTLRSRRLMAWGIDGLLCQTQVIVANCTAEDYTRPYDHICLKYFWHFSNQILYRDLVCVNHSHSHSHQNDLWQPYDDILLAYLWQGWNHFHCTLKRTSLLCLMQVNVNKHLTTNILTHMTTLIWRTFDTFHTFHTFQTSV